ncbi:MAG: Trm112 family protein [Lentisphaeria bacterium]
MISKELLEILACPACDDRPPVREAEDGKHLVCDVCHRYYPIKDGIPIMLVDKAEVRKSSA